MPYVETYRGFVNTWECDENAHLNVQYYFSMFSEAAQFAAVRAKLNGQAALHKAALPASRHVRFLAELPVSASIAIRSAIIGEGEHAGKLVHQLENLTTGQLSASALDANGFEMPGLPIASQSEIEMALPRGIAGGPLESVDTSQMLEDETAIVSHYRNVLPADCDQEGRIVSRALISFFTNGAPHIWDMMGLKSGWLEKHNLGRVAVEMKLDPLAPIQAGELLRMVSWIETSGKKTFAIRHQIEEFKSGKAVAAGAVVGLLMDLKTRRAVAMPDEVVARWAK